MSAPPDPAELLPTPGDNARESPVRLLVVQGDERPAVDATDEPMAMTFPHLVLRELIAFLTLSIVLIVASLLFDAPLGEIANPSRTPNPAKAPWYFLGLQELLHYYPPVVSGVLLPGLLIVALVIIPYFDNNLERAPIGAGRRARTLAVLWLVVGSLGALFTFTGSQPVWPLIGPLLLVGAAVTIGQVVPRPARLVGWLRSRSVPFWIFAWFLVATTVLTVVGVFFRGPGWRFTLPWRDGIFY